MKLLGVSLDCLGLMMPATQTVNCFIDLCTKSDESPYLLVSVELSFSPNPQ